MLWLRNKKIKFSLHTLNLNPELDPDHLANNWKIVMDKWSYLVSMISDMIKSHLERYLHYVLGPKQN